MWKNIIILSVLGAISLPTLASQEERCRHEAIQTMAVVKDIAEGKMPVSMEERDKAKQRLPKIEKYFSEGKFCKATQLATTE